MSPEPRSQLSAAARGISGGCLALGGSRAVGLFACAGQLSPCLRDVAVLWTVCVSRRPAASRGRWLDVCEQHGRAVLQSLLSSEAQRGKEWFRLSVEKGEILWAQ